MDVKIVDVNKIRQHWEEQYEKLQKEYLIVINRLSAMVDAKPLDNIHASSGEVRYTAHGKKHYISPPKAFEIGLKFLEAAKEAFEYIEEYDPEMIDDGY